MNKGFSYKEIISNKWAMEEKINIIKLLLKQLSLVLQWLLIFKEQIKVGRTTLIKDNNSILFSINSNFITINLS